MIHKKTERGQALILIAFAAIGLFAFSALAIDGSRAFSNKRHAQNTADTAALAAALAHIGAPLRPVMPLPVLLLPKMLRKSAPKAMGMITMVYRIGFIFTTHPSMDPTRVTRNISRSGSFPTSRLRLRA